MLVSIYEIVDVSELSNLRACVYFPVRVCLFVVDSEYGFPFVFGYAYAFVVEFSIVAADFLDFSDCLDFSDFSDCPDFSVFCCIL